MLPNNTTDAAPDQAPHPILALWDAGCHEIIPVIPPHATLSPESRLTSAALSKIPGTLGPKGWRGFPGWTAAEVTRADVERWIGDGASFGLRTKFFPAIDCDIEDVRTAALVAKVLSGALTPLVMRVGQAPRFAVPCRTDAPFTKVRIELSSGGAIEFLGDGQHYVIAGKHKSGKQYTWRQVGQPESLEPFGGLPPSGLPTLTLEIIENAILPALEAELRKQGISVRRTGGGLPRSGEAPDQAALRAPSIAELREAVSLIPNDDTWSDRAAYIQMGAAIKAAAGPENEADGFDIYLTWAGTWTEGVNDPATVRADWDGLRSPFRLGWDWVCDHARPYGFVPPDLPVQTEVSAVAALPTNGERIAALLGSASRAFLLEAQSLPDGALRGRWDSMRAAAGAFDPLRAFFRARAVPVAAKLRSAADDEHRFAIILDAELARTVKEWASHAPDDRRLMLRAAYVLMADGRVLTRQASDSPGDPLPLRNVARDDLVRGLIPAKAVAALVGPPAQGKSFLALELAARVAKEPEVEPLTREPVPERFGDREVQHGSVLYFASEDVDGWRNRAVAWASVYGDPRHLHVFGRVPPLSSFDRAVAFMLEAIDRALGPQSPPLRLIIIDVLRAAIEGEENSSDVVGPAMVAASLLARMAGATVLLVHHSALSDPERGRGSSAFTAAMDFIGAVKMSDAGIELTVKKNKSGAGGEQLNWHLRDGVLHTGLNGVARGKSAKGDACAIAAAEAIRDVADRRVGVAQSVLLAAVAESRPDLFGESVNRNTAKVRLSRGVTIATERGWIVERRGKLHPGPERPPLPDPLAGVL